MSISAQLVPGAPTNLTVIATGSSTLLVSWQAPKNTQADAAGAPIAYYDLSWRETTKTVRIVGWPIVWMH